MNWQVRQRRRDAYLLLEVAHGELLVVIAEPFVICAKDALLQKQAQLRGDWHQEVFVPVVAGFGVSLEVRTSGDV